MKLFTLKKQKLHQGLLWGLMVGLSSPVWSYGTGADGAFNPQVDTQLQLPADGIFNFTTIDIPAGVAVTFIRNELNTPVTLLATGDVTINGIVQVGGTSSTSVGSAGDGNLGNDGLPGRGGPGGFDGGRGGTVESIVGSVGLGPGGGEPARGRLNGFFGCGGGGGAFGQNGFIASGVGNTSDSNDCDNVENGRGGQAYGTAVLTPLIGGSGGGGGSAGEIFGGSGGGGGGGAILIATDTVLNITGQILANGGNSGGSAGTLSGGTGGGGAGGAIRLVADTISGNGTLSANNGLDGGAIDSTARGGDGGDGRIRLEANNITRTSNTTPTYSFGAPSELFITGLPTLRISSVAGVPAPISPTGSADIVLPETVANPVTITFETTGIPEGNTVELTLAPASGQAVSVISPALVGDETNATTGVDIDLPTGPSTLLAEVSFTVTLAMNEEFGLQQFVGAGEVVTRMRLSQGSAGAITTLITDEGKEYPLPSQMLAM